MHQMTQRPDSPTPTSDLPSPDSRMWERAIEVNQHYLNRACVEWTEGMDFLAKFNGAMLSVDKIKVYQEWVKGFSQRQAEEPAYAMETARDISGMNFKLSASWTGDKEPPSSQRE